MVIPPRRLASVGSGGTAALVVSTALSPAGGMEVLGFRPGRAGVGSDTDGQSVSESGPGLVRNRGRGGIED